MKLFIALALFVSFSALADDGGLSPDSRLGLLIAEPALLLDVRLPANVQGSFQEQRIQGDENEATIITFTSGAIKEIVITRDGGGDIVSIQIERN